MKVNDSYAFVKTDSVAKSDPERVVTKIFETHAQPVDDIDTLLRMINAHLNNSGLVLLDNFCITLDSCANFVNASTIQQKRVHTIHNTLNQSFDDCININISDYNRLKKEEAVAIIHQNEQDKMFPAMIAQIPLKIIKSAT